MKTAIIIVAIIACISLITWRLIGTYVAGSEKEALKVSLGISKLGIIVGLSYILFMLFGITFIVLLLIYLL